MAYLLDTNVFIQAKNTYYGFDFCPAFWDWLEAQFEAGEVLSISQVLDELVAGSDELTDWAEARESTFFAEVDAETLLSLAAVAQWVNANPDYEPAAKYNFLQVADYYLVATAHAHGHTLVTHERPAASRKIKIPNVCVGMNVNYLSPFEMLRRERARFVLVTAGTAETSD